MDHEQHDTVPGPPVPIVTINADSDSGLLPLSDTTLTARCVCGQREIPAGTNGVSWYWQTHRRTEACVLELPNDRCWCGLLRSEHINGHSAQTPAPSQSSQWAFCREHRVFVGDSAACPYCRGETHIIHVVPAETLETLMQTLSAATQKMVLVRESLLAADDILRAPERTGSLSDITRYLRDALRVLDSTTPHEPEPRPEDRPPLWAVFETEKGAIVFVGPSKYDATAVADDLRRYAATQTLPVHYEVRCVAPLPAMVET